ncbi:MAG: type II secretion system F family protein [Nocardioidaceae bacterium]
MLPILSALVLVLAVFVLGLRELARADIEQRRLSAAVLPRNARANRALDWRWLDRWVARTRWGNRLEEQLRVAGLTAGTSRFLLASGVVCFAAGLLLGWSLSWLLFPMGLLLGAQLVRLYIARARNNRREAFIAQMPDLARSLSNATQAGLSVRTALAMSVDELTDPASSEIRSVTDQLNLGVPLDSALTNLEQRLPSREVGILISTLVVSSRAGGGLVTALRDISTTLETRKETRREIRTTYAQAVATAYAVLGLGACVLFLLDAIQAGTVDKMLREPLGQVALLVAVAIYGAGIWAVRRMTRIEV